MDNNDKPVRPATRFRAVLNNYHVSDDEMLKRLWEEGKHFKFMVWGYEVGKEGTKHFQSYFVLKKKKSLQQMKTILGNRWHFNNCDCGHLENYNYCIKDDIWMEKGELPKDVGQGKRTDIEKFKEWLMEDYRTDKEICKSIYFSLWLRYPRATEAARILAPSIKFHEGDENVTWYPWQLSIVESIEKEEYNQRSVEFWIDEIGGKGKTFLATHLQDKYPERVQLLSSGAAKDIAYMLDENAEIFIFNIPKHQMEFVSYTIFEGIKDKFLTSGKYLSCMKKFRKNTRVLVFGNEFPNMDKLSFDRYKVTTLSRRNAPIVNIMN